MRQVLAIVGALAAAVVAAAHPGNGIAVAPDGTVYFADVARETIWRVPPGGGPVAAVRDRWTHSLQLAADGTLYYEREEPVEGVAPASFWRLTPEGRNERLIAPQSDRRSFSGGEFAIDEAGNVYYPHSVRVGGEWRTLIMKRTPSGEVSEFSGRGDGELYKDGDAATATIRIVTSMTMAPDGAIYIADRDHVRRIETAAGREGAVTTIAAGIIDEKPADPPHTSGPSTTINRIYGIAVDAAGEVLVAYSAGRRVVRIGADGTSVVVRATPGRWSPLGVAWGAGGDGGSAVYVLEAADASIEQLRVVRIEDGEVETVVELPRR